MGEASGGDGNVTYIKINSFASVFCTFFVSVILQKIEGEKGRIRVRKPPGPF